MTSTATIRPSWSNQSRKPSDGAVLESSPVATRCKHLEPKAEIRIAEASNRDAMVAVIPSLRAFAISLSHNRDQAEDLVQQALLRGFANIKSFKSGTNMLAWLFTILRNEFYSECRRRRRRLESVDRNADGLASKPTQVAQVVHHEFCAALTKLPPEQRQALILIGASGLSYDQAAKMCGCPTGTMKSRVNRARAQLAQLLSIEGPEDFEEDPIISAVVVAGDRLAAGI
jgi:RNA polymerase sigma-70 factor (ECF subfamily)